MTALARESELYYNLLLLLLLLHARIVLYKCVYLYIYISTSNSFL